MLDLQYTVSQKKTTLLWFAITSTSINRFWYFLAGMLPRKKEVKRYFIFPPHLTSASALPGKTRKHENRIFFTQMLYYCFSRVQPVAALFFQFYWLETHIVADIDSLNLIINWVQLWPVGGIAQEKWSWEFCAAAVELCYAHHALVHARAVSLKGK